MIYTSPIEIANQNSDSYFTISRRAIINVLIQVIAACVSGSVRSKWVTEAIWVQTQIRIQTTSKLQTPNSTFHPPHIVFGSPVSELNFGELNDLYGSFGWIN